MRNKTIITIIWLFAAIAMPCQELNARKAQTKAKTTAGSTAKTSGSNKKTSSKGTGGKKTTGSQVNTSKKSVGKAAKNGKNKETSADLRRQQEATQKEIRETRKQIQENEAAVKKNLNELGKLEEDIAVGKKRVAEASGKVATLNRQIDALEKRISDEENDLSKMRAEYLKAVRQMRTKSKGKSTLAFIFSSKSFNEALRRMRYMKRFSEWRENRSKEITKRVGELRKQKSLLADTKVEHDKALAAHLQAQNDLQIQYNRQDAIVVELKKNGTALNSHLAKKQAEVNALKNRVASLIAEETRKAEAERQAQARAEAERKAQAAKAEAERKQAEMARQKEEADRRAREEMTASNESKSALSEKQKATSDQKQEAVKVNRKKTEKEAGKETKKNSDVSYAEARRRRPKNKDNNKSAPLSTSSGSSAPAKPSGTAPARPAQTTSAGGNFESMKGSLPKPVSGSFRVTSRFGTHALPDLPNVTYDNPGIDAEVAKGASAQAVYGGKVSGVYMIPGYSTVVIVNHGNYYTVYGNIQAAAVKVGDSVKQGQSLGRLAPDDEDGSHSTIHFEVWKNRDKLDPLAWIR